MGLLKVVLGWDGMGCGVYGGWFGLLVWEVFGWYCRFLFCKVGRLLDVTLSVVDQRLQ